MLNHFARRVELLIYLIVYRNENIDNEIECRKDEIIDAELNKWPIQRGNERESEAM